MFHSQSMNDPLTYYIPIIPHHISLVCGLENSYFSILGMSSSQLTTIFQRGRYMYHQPGIYNNNISNNYHS